MGLITCVTSTRCQPHLNHWHATLATKQTLNARIIGFGDSRRRSETIESRVTLIKIEMIFAHPHPPDSFRILLIKPKPCTRALVRFTRSQPARLRRHREAGDNAAQRRKKHDVDWQNGSGEESKVCGKMGKRSGQPQTGSSICLNP